MSDFGMTSKMSISFRLHNSSHMPSIHLPLSLEAIASFQVGASGSSTLTSNVDKSLGESYSMSLPVIVDCMAKAATACLVFRPLQVSCQEDMGLCSWGDLQGPEVLVGLGLGMVEGSGTGMSSSTGSKELMI